MPAGLSVAQPSEHELVLQTGGPSTGGVIFSSAIAILLALPLYAFQDTEHISLPLRLLQVLVALALPFGVLASLPEREVVRVGRSVPVSSEFRVKKNRKDAGEGFRLTVNRSHLLNRGGPRVLVAPSEGLAGLRASDIQVQGERQGGVDVFRIVLHLFADAASGSPMQFGLTETRFANKSNVEDAAEQLRLFLGLDDSVSPSDEEDEEESGMGSGSDDDDNGGVDGAGAGGSDEEDDSGAGIATHLDVLRRLEEIQRATAISVNLHGGPKKEQ